MTIYSVIINCHDDQMKSGTADVWVISERVAAEIKRRLGRPPDGEALMPTIGKLEPDTVLLVSE